MIWRRSTYCGGGECVEVATDWRKSTYSAMGGCVEVARADAVYVRDTKDRGGPVLSFDRRDWSRFLGTLEQGDRT